MFFEVWYRKYPLKANMEIQPVWKTAFINGEGKLFQMTTRIPSQTQRPRSTIRPLLRLFGTLSVTPMPSYLSVYKH